MTKQLSIVALLLVAVQSLISLKRNGAEAFNGASSVSPLFHDTISAGTPWKKRTAATAIIPKPKDSHLRQLLLWNNRGGSAAFKSTKDDDVGGIDNDPFVGGESWEESTSHDGIMATAFDAVATGRYACTRFEPSNNATIQRQAMHCLNLSRRSPSGFNAQPYRMIFVHSPEAKKALSKYCLGRNADRVLDSDCTVVFLADKQCSKDFSKLENSIIDRLQSKLNNSNRKMSEFTRQKEQLALSKKQKWMVRKIKALVLLFSSGYPMPRFISIPFSWAVRLGVSTVSALTRRRVLVPSLGTAETWAVKNTMLVAMTFMLGCTSRGLATCPMEGFNAGGVRKALNIQTRFAVPLIVSVGVPYQTPQTDDDHQDDTGMVHGSLQDANQKDGATNNIQATSRYPLEETIFGDNFGGKLQLPP